jgi:hypothetical protein
MNNRVDCMQCGMLLPQDVVHCPKCDDLLDAQSDGSIMTVDIAHDRETVRDAMSKLSQTLIEVDRARGAGARFIVGTGRIREAVSAELATHLYRKDILSFEFEGSNEGAILVLLRKPFFSA